MTTLPGYNYRMEGMQGAILRVKLRHLEPGRKRGGGIAAYSERLLSRLVATPRQMPYARHVYHVYAIRVAHRRFAEPLNAAGVQTGIHYPIPVHLQPAYRDPRYREGDFPVAEQAAAQVLSLPIYAELTNDQVAAVAGLVCDPALGALTPAFDRRTRRRSVVSLPAQVLRKTLRRGAGGRYVIELPRAAISAVELGCGE